MMPDPIVIALSGKKGSGKNTVSTFIRNYFSSHWYKGCRGGCDFCMEVAFADSLKEFCINVLGLERSQCYGTDEEKNTPTKYLWENTPAAPAFNAQGESTGPMTGREVMQVFGTESVRAWFGNVWADATMRKISQLSPALAIVTDNRFPNEIKSVLGHPKGYIVRLTREPFGSDDHLSETALDDYDWNHDRCFVIDNASLSKEEQVETIKPVLDSIFSQELEDAR